MPDKFTLPHLPTIARKPLLHLLTQSQVDPEDQFFFRFDPQHRFDKIHTPGFRLRRIVNIEETNMDLAALGDVYRNLSKDEGLFRLGWWNNWEACRSYILRSMHYWDEPLVITRISKEALLGHPGLNFVQDMHLPGEAILSYAVEPMTEEDQFFSATEILFEQTEFLLAEFGWHSGKPKPVPVPVQAPSPRPLEVWEFPATVTLKSLASGAGRIREHIERREHYAFEFGDYARKALNAAGIKCGSTDRDQFLFALLKVDATTPTFHRTEPDPARLATGLLLAICSECERVLNPWDEGEEELQRRAELKGIHRLVWWLRDRGHLRMNGVQYVRDPEPMFP